MDGADARVVGLFFCVCFELRTLALAAEWSSWATYPAVITSKPPRPNPDPTLEVERPTVRVGGEGEGRYMNEKGRIWSLSHFCHALCWHEGGIMQL